MNRAYRLVWSHVQNRLVVAAEIASGRGKNGSKSAATLPVALLGCLALAISVSIPTLALADPPAANQLPTGGQVVAGQASISQQAARMDIHQQTDKAIINWQGFDIGSQAQVNFNQPSSSSVALNRVLSSNPSQIYGQLNANGQVYLVNPNGVVFGQGSQVNVGGLIASSLDITNQDFLDGKRTFTRGNAKGGILNQGSIKAHQGGSIALIAPKVVNEGIVTAQMGNVVLASGNKVTLSDGANGLIQVAVEPSTIESLIENKALIKADGGQVIMTASAAGTLQGGIVNNSGTVQAQSLQNKDGRILLLGDMQHGETQAAGKLSAKFVETSAAKVVLDKDLKVDTQGGEWLIDPVDITIDSTKAQAIQTGLNSGDVTISTANGAHNEWGNNSTGTDKGDIHVNADITYTQNKLTLNADNNINLNAVINVNDNGTLALNYGAQGNINASFGVNGGFAGKVNFVQSGPGLLTINGSNYSVIKDVTALQNMNSGFSGKYVLGSDIDASATKGWNNGEGFEPIGTASFSYPSSSNPFSGTFDGLGHVINDLTINRPDTDYVGLFGATSNASIRNSGLDGLDVKGRDYVGGLVGGNGYTISIYNNFSSSISNSYASGSVTGRGRSVGGLVGSNSSSSSISNSSASGSVSGEWNYVGGLVGWNGGSISNSTASGSVRGDLRVGGLVGGNYNGSISNSTASGSVAGQEVVGGLVGENYNNSSISNSIASGSVRGDWTVGGLVGENYNSSISNSTASGSVDGYRDNIGGLVGYNENGSISSSYASGSVRGDLRVGGLVGENENGSISNSTASGSVDGYRDVGGLVGANNSNSSSISNSTANGSVIGNSRVGGLVGLNYYSSISNSTANGRVTGDWRVGGLVGDNYNSSISSSFWDINTTGRANGCGYGDCTGATGKITVTAALVELLPSAGDIYRDTTQTSGNSAGMGQPHDPGSLMMNYTPSLQPIGEQGGFPGMGTPLITLAPDYVAIAPGAIALGDPPAAGATAEDGKRAKRRRGRR